MYSYLEIKAKCLQELENRVASLHQDQNGNSERGTNIDEGIVPMMFAEGGYNSRLAVIQDLPKGKVIWHFDRTDMARAKETLGDSACIMGNVPASLLFSGTPGEVKDYCEKLIDAVGRGGGFILAEGAVIDEGKPDNLLAVVQAAKEYGVYKGTS